MRSNTSIGGILGAGLIAALAASLCCITPVLMLIAGASGIASNFSWMEPARPWLAGITVAALGLAWWRKLKPKKGIECDCETDKKQPFRKSVKFLIIVTVFAGGMLAFPHYAHIFYPETEKQEAVADRSKVKTVELAISGMTCKGCEEHVKYKVNQLNGIVEVHASAKKETAVVVFDTSRTTTAKIETAIRSAGYKVTGKKER